ncbi:MAG: hypothetical protein EOP54_15840 [Sphingobacteriales bacterium]|nr:MAG: hypothetical protein EOP54_15840 [Sphingobacteriales bacterium]
MNKHEFSPAGLQALLAELYQLSDSELALEVAAIIANYRSWLSSHFDFEPGQAAYLDAMDNQFIAAAALATSEFRSPAHLYGTDPRLGDGNALGWGTAEECAATDCGTVPAHRKLVKIHHSMIRADNLQNGLIPSSP